MVRTRDIFNPGGGGGGGGGHACQSSSGVPD